MKAGKPQQREDAHSDGMLLGKRETADPDARLSLRDKAGKLGFETSEIEELRRLYVEILDVEID